MPQKRNPDSLELRVERRATSWATGRLLATLNGMPTGYQKDLQQNNAAMSSAGSRRQAAELLGGVVETLVPDAARMASALDPRARDRPRRSAGDVRMAFRDAHALVGAWSARRGAGCAADRVSAARPSGSTRRFRLAARVGGPEAAVERRALRRESRSAVMAQLDAARAASPARRSSRRRACAAVTPLSRYDKNQAPVGRSRTWSRQS